MRIDVRCRQLEESDTISSHAHRRLRFALARFEPQIMRVRVTVEDLNGPKGGIDKRCSIVMSGKWSEAPVVIDTQASSWAEAVDRACDAAARAVARGLARRLVSYVAPAPSGRSATTRERQDV